MNWTKFKENYLFTVNFGIMCSVLLYSFRKDFLFHPLIALWTVTSLGNARARGLEKKVLHLVGRVNSTVLLTSFYFLFFTPFSFIYRGAFRNKAFQKADTRFVAKDAISDFDRPF